MRNFLFAALVSTSLAGCATSGTVTPTIPPIVNTIINDVAIACSFAPTIETVLELLGAAPGASVSAIVNMICGAVTTHSVRRGARHAAIIRVNGRVVPINGQFLR